MDFVGIMTNISKVQRPLTDLIFTNLSMYEYFNVFDDLMFSIFLVLNITISYHIICIYNIQIKQKKKAIYRFVMRIESHLI